MAKFLFVLFCILVAIYLLLFVSAILIRRKFKNRAVLTGGGSSGHIYPAIAIGKWLQPEINDFIFIGAKGRIEEKVVPKENLQLKLIRAYPYSTSLTQFPKFLIFLMLGILKCSFILCKFQPKFIIGTGGFVSAPVVFAGYGLKKLGLLNSKIILQEQNVSPGKLNLLAGKIADKVLVTFPQSLYYFGSKGYLIGYPVRKNVKSVNVEERSLNDSIKGRKLIFASGGSQGSKSINRAVVDSLSYLLPYKDKIYIILSCGLGYSDYNGLNDVKERLESKFKREEIEEIKKFFTYKDYYYNVGEILSKSSLVIGRSGAGTIFELSEMGVPSILIPKMGLSGEHQVMNAIAMKKAGGAKLVFEQPIRDEMGIEGKELADAIIELTSNEELLKKMGESAKKVIPHFDTEKLVREIILEGKDLRGIEEGTKIELVPLLSPEKILSKLSQLREEKKEFQVDEDQKQYYESLTMNLLRSNDWKKRNQGIKLLAFFKIAGAKEKLIASIGNREKVNRFKRFLGGDFEEVGFIRRNSLYSLKSYDISEKELLDLFLISSDDPYYEVRSGCLNLIKEKCATIKKEKEHFLFMTKKLASDKELEVKEDALSLLGELGGEEEVEFLLSFSDNYFWQLRNSALKSILRMNERGIIKDKEKVSKKIDEFILTSTSYKPIFEIKENFGKLKRSLKGM